MIGTPAAPLSRLARRSLPVLVALAIAALPAAAQAQSARVLVGGPGARATRASVSSVVHARIEAQQWRMVDEPASQEDIDALIRCLGTEGTRECSDTFLEAAAVDRMVVVSVKTEGRHNPTVEMAGWIVAKTGDIVVTERRTCRRCRALALESTVSELVAALWRQATVRTSPTTLVLRSVPVGASVEVDGKPAGTSDFNLITVPGKHSVSFRREGYRTESREVEVASGQTVLVEVELKGSEAAPRATPKPAPVATPAPRADDKADEDEADDAEAAPAAHGRGWKPWAVVGVGAATAIAGAALVLTDEDEVMDDAVQARWRDTAPLGVGLLIGGGLVAAAGATWALWPGHEADGSGAQVGVAGGRLWLGYQGRF